jgi:uncharacterized protein YjdB
MVTAVGAGTGTITASSESKTGSILITVLPVGVASVSVSPSAISLTVGASSNLSVTVRDAAQNVLPSAVMWVSSDNTVASVDASGRVTGIKQGNVTIVATSQSNTAISGASVVTVLAGISGINSFTVAPTMVSLGVGQSTTVIANISRDAGVAAPTVNWSSQTPAVATVDQDGTITGVAAGTAVITAAIRGDGITQTQAVAVIVSSVQVAAVSMNVTSLAINAGDARVLIATIKDGAGNVLTDRLVTWTSTNLTVVDGSVFGDTAVVTGLTAGTAILTATIDGHSASTSIVVSAPQASVCSTIAGASIYGSDNQFLGTFSNQYATNSVQNIYGMYGSQYSVTSTNDTYGQYGSPYSALSARNPYAAQPPVIVKNGQTIGYYTANQFKTPGVSPAYAMTCSFP